MERSRESPGARSRRGWFGRVVAVITAGVVVASGGFLVGAAQGAAGYRGADVVAKSGKIIGTVLCGAGEGEMGSTTPAPRPDAKVFLVGTGFTAMTDENGRFVIDYVPPGTYPIAVLTNGWRIRPEVGGEQTSIRVARLSVTTVAVTVMGGCTPCGGEEGGGGMGGGGTGGGCEDEGGCEGGM
jgi:hypothetical protein